jgi:hypothetical protein
MRLRDRLSVALDRARDGTANWRTFEGPLRTKLALAVRNRLRATVAAERCCGHPGEPGC